MDIRKVVQEMEQLLELYKGTGYTLSDASMPVKQKFYRDFISDPLNEINETREQDGKEPITEEEFVKHRHNAMVVWTIIKDDEDD